MVMKRSLPAILAFLVPKASSQENSSIFTYELPWFHPEIQWVAENRTGFSGVHPMLDDHADFQMFIGKNTGRRHQFYDGERGFIQLPWRLPGGHPYLDDYFTFAEEPVDDLLTVYFSHPDINDAFLNGNEVPNWHPSVDDLLENVLPNNHPDVNELFTNHSRVLPEWHIDLSILLTSESPIPVQVFVGHPDPQEMFMQNQSIPNRHASVTAMLGPYLPPNHPGDLDDMLRNPSEWSMPDFHPTLNEFLSQNSSLNNPFVVVKDETLDESNEEIDHESAQDESSSSVSTFESFWSVPTFSVFYAHPDLNEDYDMGDPIDDHPSIYHMFEDFLPDGHPNIDNLMRRGFILPSYHPDIRTVVQPRSLFSSPASILSYCVSSLAVAILLIRSLRKLKRRTRLIPPPPAKPGNWFSDALTLGKGDSLKSDPSMGKFDVIKNANDDDSVEVEYKLEGLLPSLDRQRHRAMEMHRKHRDNDLSSSTQNVREDIVAYNEKKNTVLRSIFVKLTGKRALKSDVSTGVAINCLIYVLINIAALFASPFYETRIGLGSLSAGNTLFLVIAATRNSVFTWMIGFTFDQMLVYHRFIGRLTVVISLIHSALHYDDIYKRTSERITVTGLVALGSGVIIFLTSLNYFRRKLFNVFFWSHLALVGFIVGMYLHAAGARPYLLAAVACYSVDKVLQTIWTQLPRRTTLFEKVGDRTAHVQFKKTPLVNMLGRYKVGQYVFVNFPHLSLHEWHPFSVASAPGDPFVDLYIRALGNHTKKIVEYSERCAAEHKQALVRCDGPYGDLSFNYRRYGSLLLVGAGIGITPIISVLKDIYTEVGTPGNRPRQCIRKVTLVWIMPHVSEAALFLDLLDQYQSISSHEPLAPALHLAIYITREDEKCRDERIMYSRPDFDTLMERCVINMDDSSRSILVYACGPGGMVNQLWDASRKKINGSVRVDFYHESFEF